MARPPVPSASQTQQTLPVNGVLKLNFPMREPPSARRLQIPIGNDEGAAPIKN